MTRTHKLLALLLVFSTMLGLSACDNRPQQPTQINDCRVDDDNDSIDVLQNCREDEDFENSVEVDDD